MPGYSVCTLAFSTLRDAMFTMLVCATCWLSMHLYTLSCMFMHESCLLVCRPYFNTIKSWTSDPNLHLSPHRHHLLFAFFLVWLLPFLFALYFACLSCCLSCLLPHVILALLVCLSTLYPYCIIYTSLFSIACLLVSCLCLCMYTHGARTHGARTWSPKCKQKGCGCKHIDMSQATMFNRFWGLASPIWLCTLLNPLPSSLISLLNGLY